MTQIDFNILNFIQEHLRTAWGDVIFPIISCLGNAGIIWIILTVILLCIPKFRKYGVTLVIALIIDLLLCNVIIKPIVARIRPYDINTSVKLLITAPTDYSFPSGHTASSFTAVSALYFSKCRLWIYSFVLAALIAFSRLYLYVHYPSDVLAGIILGILIGWFSCFLYKKFILNHKQKTEP